MIDAVTQLREEFAAQLKVHRAAVVWIYKAEVPKFGALIDIRIAGRHYLQSGLCQRIHGPEECNQAGELSQKRDEVPIPRPRTKRFRDELTQCVHVFRIRV